MKRRNAEGGKLRRPIKRTKISDNLYGSTFTYIKFFALWGIVLMADYLLEFRFEFLWPFWLLLRSVYDSFKYQGLAFSVLFVCVAATSDMVCFFFIPFHWLFFLASTYVWVQYVWHTEKGICLPTVALCILFVYVEATVRMREFKQPPFHMDLCRPFAAHCIGYPVVTFGFGIKSYVGYRMRQRKQREVAKDNEYYMELLQQALPPRPEPPSVPQTVAIISTLPDKSSRVVCITPNDPEGKLPNGLVVNGVPITPTVPNGTTKNNHRRNVEKAPDREKIDESKKISHAHTNCSINKFSERSEDSKKSSVPPDVEYIERLHTVNDFDANEPEKEKVSKGCNNRSQEKSGKWGNNKPQETPSNCLKEKKSRSNKEQHEPNNVPVKDEHVLRLEGDVKRLKADLQASRQIEQDLRSQLNASVGSERMTRQELSQLQSCNDDLQNRVHGLVSARQTDKQSLAAMEKRLGDERRIRSNCEATLAAERKAKRQEESAALAVMASALNKAECTESCRQRRRELESESKTLRRDVKLKDDRLMAMDREIQSLRQYKESQNDTEILMSALSAMQDKNGLLENSLKAETRIKLDLFSALGEAKRQLELRESLIRSQEKELEELKGKMAQVLAVMPSESFCPSPPALSGASSKFRIGESHIHCYPSEDDFSAMSSLRSLTESPVSTLDPNATVYTPKGKMVTSTEA